MLLGLTPENHRSFSVRTIQVAPSTLGRRSRLTSPEPLQPRPGATSPRFRRASTTTGAQTNPFKLPSMGCLFNDHSVPIGAEFIRQHHGQESSHTLPHLGSRMAQSVLSSSVVIRMNAFGERTSVASSTFAAQSETKSHQSANSALVPSCRKDLRLTSLLSFPAQNRNPMNGSTNSLVCAASTNVFQNFHQSGVRRVKLLNRKPPLP